MRTILIPILSAIFCLTTLLSTKKISAQTKVNNCFEDLHHHSYSTKFDFCHQNSHSLTSQKWRKLVKKYYRTRYRTQFKENNGFLSLKEVNDILGFSGSRSKVTKENHQYLSWQDSEDPKKRIEAVFVYSRLVGLRSRGFDRPYARQFRTQIPIFGDR